MRESLDTLINQTIALEYTLPNEPTETPKIMVSTASDECYKILTQDFDLAKIIYNGIVDYSFEESAIDLTRLDVLQARALKSKLKFDADANIDQQLNYGLYGEVLLHLMLQKFHNTGTMISRGHFYNILNSSETTGYDTYQMRLMPDGNIELWFGEVKFHKDFRTGITQILDKIGTSLSDDYFGDNIIAMEDYETFVSTDVDISPMLDAFREDPEVNLAQIADAQGLSFIYPMLVIFNDEEKAYDEIIKNVVNYTNRKYPSLNLNFSLECKLFFMFLPVKLAKDIKELVRSWIMSKEPLI